MNIILNIDNQNLIHVVHCVLRAWISIHDIRI